MFSETGLGVDKNEDKTPEVIQSDASSSEVETDANSENIESSVTLDVSADNDKSLYDSWQTASGGLKAEANLRLYDKDPSMKGKSKEIRTSRYKELFEVIDFKSITNPLGF